MSPQREVPSPFGRALVERREGDDLILTNASEGIEVRLAPHRAPIPWLATGEPTIEVAPESGGAPQSAGAKHRTRAGSGRAGVLEVVTCLVVWLVGWFWFAFSDNFGPDRPSGQFFTQVLLGVAIGGPILGIVFAWIDSRSPS